MQIIYETKASAIFLIDSTYQITKDSLIVIPENNRNRFKLSIINRDLRTVYSELDYEYL